MPLETWIQTHGYWLVALGTFLEGETILLLAGAAAHRGTLDLHGVMLAALLGSVAGDQLFFQLGRRWGAHLLARHPRWKRRFGRIDARLVRHRNLLVAGFRFLYGLRTLTPFALGLGDLSALRFTALEVAGAVVWSIAVASFGYGLGEAATRLLGPTRHAEAAAFALIVTVALLVHTGRALRRRRSRHLN